VGQCLKAIHIKNVTRCSRGIKCETTVSSYQAVIVPDGVSTVKDKTDDYCPSCLEPCSACSILCSICHSNFHQECSGLQCDTFKTLLTIVHESGWVCGQCRDAKRGKFVQIEIALAKTNEAIANISISIANLTQEIDSLK